MTEEPVALVTGSSRGIGRGIAEHLLKENYRVVGCSRSEFALQDGMYQHYVVDVGSTQQVHRWVNGVARSHGRIDVVVNNAGVGPAALALMASDSQVESTLRTNFLGTFSVSRESARVMLRRRFGRIINISSISLQIHMKGASAYAASKGAVVAFSKVLARELGPSGITCNVVSLPLVEGGMSSHLTQEAREEYRRYLVMDRWAAMEDICNVVSFLASPSSGYVTGQVIHLGYVD